MNANPPFVIQLDHINRLCDAAMDQLQDEADQAVGIQTERFSDFESLMMDPLLPGCRCCSSSCDHGVSSAEARFLADARQ